MQAAKRKTRWGRWLLGIILALLLVAYFIIWFVVTKPMIGDFVDTWLEDQRAMGFEIEYSDRRVEGFPLNFELVFDDPVVTIPGGNAKWEGEQLRLHSRVWDFYPMLLNKWGKVQAYVPGKSIITERSGASADLELGSGSKVEIAWTSEAPQYALINVDKFQGTVIERRGAPAQNLGLDDFRIDVKPTNSAGEPPVFQITASWDKVTLPDQVAKDPDTPAMVLAMANEPQEGLTATIRDGGVYFLGNRVADLPPGLIAGF